ncbi:MAG TPA: 4'-phosphopantetheinyl transferase superfamily protein [Myxococcota bacterium]|nr:4'-phosphopantetheinyl transferase superfamily protein [Myxococcota bacterium]
MSAAPTARYEVFAAYARARALVREGAVGGARVRAALSPAERAAFARLRPAGARRDYLAAHTLAAAMRAAMRAAEAGSRGGPPPAGARVADRGAAGPLALSLSHAGGVVLCAAGRGCAIGADVESLANVGHEPLALTDEVLAPSEQRALRAWPTPVRAARLACSWTVKEAVAKATGLGVGLPFAWIAVRWDQRGAPRVELDARLVHDARRWWLWQWWPSATHVATVAACAPSAARVTIRVEPLLGEDGTGAGRGEREAGERKRPDLVAVVRVPLHQQHDADFAQGP